MKEMTLGDLHLASTGRTVPATGQSATKTANLRGTAELFSVRSPQWEMTIAHNRWNNGDRDTCSISAGPLRSDSIVSERPPPRPPPRRDHDECSVGLMQAQMGENDHPTLRKVDLAELSRVPAATSRRC